MLSRRHGCLALLAWIVPHTPVMASSSTTVRIDILWPGQQPEVIERKVVHVIDMALMRLSSLVRTRSIISEGRCSLDVEFKDQTDEQALAQVRTALAAVASKMPLGASEPALQVSREPIPPFDAPVRPPTARTTPRADALVR
jgi:multidrug efflux pump subunit AcrB